MLFACVCAFYHSFVCIGRRLNTLLHVCTVACSCLCVHILYVCRHDPEFTGSDSFDSYTCQWPDLGDNPCCRHKADRKAPISPLPDTGPVCEGRGAPVILHNTLSSFHPTNTWMGIQLILFHPSPFSHPAWHRERILCSSALPCVLHIREKTYRKGR